jgi:outer membrane protein
MYSMTAVQARAGAEVKVMIGKMVQIIMLCSMVFLKGALAYAQSPEPSVIGFDKEAFIDSADNRDVLELTLNDCVELALKNNLTIMIKRKDPVIAEKSIKKAEGAYEPALTGYYNYEETKAPGSLPSLTGNTQDRAREKDYDIGIEGKAFSNTRYEIGWNNYTKSSNSALQRYFPDYSSTVTGTVIQPLSKDFFGLSQDRANIVIAKNNKEISDYAFLDEAIKIVTDTKSVYYDYQSGIDQYQIGQAALERSQSLKDIIQKRYDKGMASSAELLEAEAGVAKREEALLAFERALKKAEDNLKLITNLVDNPSAWNADILIKDKPDFEIKDINLTESIKEAFENRPDYKSAQTDLKNKDINIKTAKNSLLPTIDLVGTYAASGLGKKYSNALDDVKDLTNDSWGAGVTVRIPFGFEKERSDYEISRLEKEKAVISFSLLEKRIILEVRDAVRDADIAYRNVLASKKTLDAEQKTYRANKERFSQGMVSTHDMLQYQENFDIASLNYLNGLIYYSKALNNLDKTKGTALTKNDITVEG